jgi:hypothetical protein
MSKKTAQSTGTQVTGNKGDYKTLVPMAELEAERRDIEAQYPDPMASPEATVKVLIVRLRKEHTACPYNCKDKVICEQAGHEKVPTGKGFRHINVVYSGINSALKKLYPSQKPQDITEALEKAHKIGIIPQKGRPPSLSLEWRPKAENSGDEAIKALGLNPADYS